MTDSVLTLKEFGVAFGEKVILSSINLEVPETGVVTLMGPSGTGKSTLLRSLAGLSAASPSYRTWGEAIYAGNELGKTNEYPSLVSQSARLMMSSIKENIVFGLPERNTLTKKQQTDLVSRLLDKAGLGDYINNMETCVVELPLGIQRLLAILRVSVSSPRLICIDEPTTGVEDEKDVELILDFIKKTAERHAIITVLHNQPQTRKLGGEVALLAGGWIQENKPTREFFEAPESDLAQEYVKSGSCTAPSPGAKPEDINPDLVHKIRPLPEAAKEYKSHVLGPRGFLWLKKGFLAGTPKPGLLVDIEQDLEALQRVGIKKLISLTERELDIPACEGFDIEVFRSPMPDMDAPTLEQAWEICEEMTNSILDEKPVAVHCRAGLGRTGTVLAAQLIYEGQTALEALEKARNIEPRWVQSEVQVEFLEKFELFVAEKTGNRIQAASSDVG